MGRRKWGGSDVLWAILLAALAANVAVRAFSWWVGPPGGGPEAAGVELRLRFESRPGE